MFSIARRALLCSTPLLAKAIITICALKIEANTWNLSLGLLSEFSFVQRAGGASESVGACHWLDDNVRSTMEKSALGLRTVVERRHVMLEQQDTVSTSKEIFSLTKMLAEKDATLSAQAEHLQKLQKLQKEYTFNLHRRAAQNEEIILHNKTLYKENLQLREQMKILQHEHNQMTSMFKLMETELRFKNEEMQHQLNMLLMDKQMQISHKAAMTALKTQTRTTSSRRHSISTGHLLQDIDYNRPCSNPSAKTKDEAPTSRSLRSRGAVASKETSYKERWDLPVAASKSIHSRCKVSGLEAMDRVSEGDESVSSCPSAESIAHEFEGSARVEEADNVKGGVKSQKQLRYRKSGFVVAAPATEAAECCRGSSDGNGPSDENISSGNTEPPKTVKQPRQGLSPVASKSESPQSSLQPPIVTASGRPMRRATAGVASYKEPPLNTKMRRPV